MAGWRDKRGKPPGTPATPATPPAGQPAGRPAPQPASNPGVRSWRRGKPIGSSTVGKSAPPGMSLHPSQTKARNPRLLPFLMSLLGVALIALLVAILIWWPRQTHLLFVQVAEYNQKEAQILFPPNGLADEDRKFFQSVMSHNLHVQYNPADQVTRGPLLKQLSAQVEREFDWKPGGPNHDMYMLYLSVQGMVNAEGEPCLLDYEARPNEPKTWVPVKDLLRTLADLIRKTGPIPKLVVFLDTGAAEGDWGLFSLERSFTRKLDQQLEQLFNNPAETPGIKQLFVVTGCGPDEVCYRAPELKGTVFGHFTALGIERAADRDKNKQVTLHEMRDYLQDMVAKWVGTKRGDRQTPRLYPSNAPNLPLTYTAPEDRARLTKTKDSEESLESGIVSSPEKLIGLWKRMEQLAESPLPAWRTSPWLWAEAQFQLLRAERFWLGGAKFAASFEAALAGTDRTIEQLEKRVDADRKRITDWRDKLPFLAARQWSGVSDRAPPLMSALSRLDENAATAGPAGPPGAEPSKADPAAKPDAGDGKTASSPAATVPSMGNERRQLDPAYAQWQMLLRQRDASQLQLETAARQMAKAAPNASLSGELFLTRWIARDLDWRPAEAGVADSTMPELAAQLVRCREAAERAASPADLRTWWAIQAAVDRADALRRQAEDLALIGQPDSLTAARLVLQKVLSEEDSSGYPPAQLKAARRSDAMKNRDQMLAELPWLVYWLSTRAVATPAELKPADLLLQETLTGLHAFSQQLDDAAHETNWEPAYQSSWTAFQKLRGEFTRVCDDVVNILGAQGSTTRQQFEVLRSPLIPAETRSRILRNLHAVMNAPASEVRQQEDIPTQLVGSRSSGDGSQDAFAPLVRNTYSNWPVHPYFDLLAIGGSEAIAAATLDESRLGRTGTASTDAEYESRLKELDQLRSGMAGGWKQLEARQNELETEQRQAGGDIKPEDWVKLHGTWSGLDRTARAQAVIRAAVVTESVLKRREPSARRIDYDVAAWLNWQSSRVMGDFWGPLDEGKEPFFVTVAAQLLKLAADAAEAGQSSGLNSRWFAVNRSQLEDLKESARRGISLKPQEFSLTNEEEQKSHEVASAPAPHIPAGQGAFLFQPAGSPDTVLALDQQNQPVRRRPLSVQQAEEFKHQFRKSELPQQGSDLQAVALYRGHRWQSPFRWRELKEDADEVAVVPPKPLPPQVIVRGDTKRQVYLVVILDCSGSMNQKIIVEGREVRRFDLARQALQTLLEQLSTTGAYRVAFVLYGHRSGFVEVKDADGFKTYPMVLGPLAQGRIIHPDADVEFRSFGPGASTNPFGELTGQLLQTRIVPELDQLEPLGATPLYYAIWEGLNRFENVAASKGAPRRILVLTDGLQDVVFKDVAMKGSGDKVSVPGDARKDATMVEQKMKSDKLKDVRIDIVGFQTPDSAKATDEDKVKLKNTESIATQSGGGFYQVSDPKQLVKTLLDSIGRVEFQVRGKDEPAPSDWKPLGERWPVETIAPGTVKPFDVVTRGRGELSTSVTLEGGELIDLVFNERTQRLEHHRYPEPDAETADLISSYNSGGRYFIGYHTPTRLGKRVDFPISVQQWDETLFQPRPKMVWAEVVPEFREPPDRQPRFIFYDPQWLPDKPVPVFDLRVDKWPDTAARARIQFWFREELLPPFKTIKYDDVAGRGLITLEGINAEFSWKTDSNQNGVRLTFIEKHASPENLYSLKLQFQPAPDRLLRQYLSESNQVRHILEYQAGARLDSLQALIWRRADLLQGAVAVPVRELIVPR